MTTENWYLKNKSRIRRGMKFAIPHYKQFITKVYGKETTDAVVAETLERFESLLSEIPNIGGDENILTENLYLSAAMLTMYQTLKRRGKSVEEVATLIHQGTSAFYSSFPFQSIKSTAIKWNIC